MVSLAIVYHQAISDYDFGPGHPFRGERFPRYMRLLRERGILDLQGVELHEPEAAEDRDLLLVHTESYIRMVEDLAERRIPLSPDTPLNPGILRACRMIVGGSLKAGILAAEGRVKVAQGVGGGLHHAGRDYGGGFCIFNDVAVCAKALIERMGLRRILILDSDAHAGNGTMDIFYSDPRVLYISVHQDPRTIYPGTGFIDQLGEGEGEGYTVNIPLPPGAGDISMRLALDRVFKPLAEAFKPQVLIRNGGTDPHHADGLARLGLTFQGLRSIGSAVAEAASKAGCGVVDLVCSGYNPATVEEGWLAILSGEAGLEVETPEEETLRREPLGLVEETGRVIEALLRRLRNYWSL